MSPSQPFILRPVATSLLMVAILLAGAVAFTFLPLSALPEVDYPTIQVQTLYPGASPEVMTTSVTAPLEEQFGEMPGLAQMTSSSSGGASVITLQFSLDLNIDVAEQEVQAAINAASNLLPANLPAPPIYAKVNPADAPVLTLAVTSRTLSLTQVEDLIDTRLSQKISQLPGVGLVTLSGGQRPAVRIQANLRKLAAHGLNIDDLRTTIANTTVNGPKGNFDGPTRASTINANDQLSTAREYRNIVIAYNNGAPVMLSDVATVIDGAENSQLAAWVDTTPAIVVNIQRQPGANVIAVVDDIKRLLPSVVASLPAGLDVRIVTDRTTTIRASVADVEFELVLAVALVVMVMFLFLRSIRATIIPSLSVPLSLVGTFGVMYLLGFSLNNLSLMALTISTGFVVDDAIVMIENISRYVEEGETPLQAALKGSAQIGFTIISLTISLIAVLIPLLFMGDVVGRLFREFAITLAAAIVISAVVSLTLVPMLCAKLLRHVPEDQQGWVARKSQAAFQAGIDFYGRHLEWVLDHKAIVMAVFAATLAVTALLYILIPKGFFPVQDTGLIQGISEADQTVSFAAMGQRQEQLAHIVLQNPNVVSLTSFIGIDGTNTTLNAGRFLINLKPKDERRASATDIIRQINHATADLPGIRLYMQPVQDLTIDSTLSKTQYQLVLEDANAGELATWTPKIVAAFRALPELQDVASNSENNGLATFINVDRDTASRFGITMATVDNALYDAYGQRIVTTIFTETNQYRVILEAEPDLQKTMESLNAIFLPSTTAGALSNGQGQVPLSAFAHASQQTSPLVIDHLGQFPAVTVSFNVASGSSLGDAVNAINRAERDLHLPPALFTSFQGAAQAFQASLTNELLLILAAIVTMYIILGVLYESYIHPLTILSTLPSAGVGALLALMIDGSDLDIVAIIGIILLIGIVKKNAIMMIDFALDAERHQGRPPHEAIYQASLLRFRPILMTTMAALLGAVPLVIGSGAGSELRRPLGVAIIGGLLLSQLLTLFTTPVIYLVFDEAARRFTGRGTARAPNPSPAE